MKQPINFTYIVWILSIFLLLPFLIPLAIYTRKTALRLDPAAGPQKGVFGPHSEKTIHLTMIGESTVAGVGVENQRMGLAASTAISLSEHLNCKVHWQAIGENQIDIAGTIERLLEKVEAQQTDYLVICLGVNDTTGLTSLTQWHEAISKITIHLTTEGCRHIYFNAIPPMEKFTALPQLLRFVLGLRAKLLQQVLTDHPLQGNLFQQIPSLPLSNPEHLAIDGYHPSESGYRLWGKKIADYILETEQSNPS